MILKTFEEFCTILHQLKAILELCPITPMSNDPNHVLAPKHFLIRRRLTWTIQKWKTIDYYVFKIFKNYEDSFGQFRWSKDFLGELQTRLEWTQSHDELKPNILMVILDDNLPQIKWELGQIQAVYACADGIAGVDDVKIASDDPVIIFKALSFLAQISDQFHLFNFWYTFFDLVSAT